MNADIKKFLESGLLEKYLLGETDATESRKVEHFLASSDEVRAEFAAMQSTLERAAKEMASPPPAGMRSEILRQIDTPERPLTEVNTLPKRNYWAAAASVAALLFGLLAFYFFGKINDLEKENLTAQTEINNLRSEMETQQAACQNLEEKLLLLSHPDTRSFRLNGNEKSPRFEAIAFWNETAESGLVNLAALPDLPEKKCFQMWADVDGEMLSVGILDGKGGNLQALTYLPEATSLNVTIEPEGGSDHPTVADLVANVAI